VKMELVKRVMEEHDIHPIEDYDEFELDGILYETTTVYWMNGDVQYRIAQMTGLVRNRHQGQQEMLKFKEENKCAPADSSKCDARIAFALCDIDP
jgi:hypothetical protein